MRNRQFTLIATTCLAACRATGTPLVSPAPESRVPSQLSDTNAVYSAILDRMFADSSRGPILVSESTLVPWPSWITGLELDTAWRTAPINPVFRTRLPVQLVQPGANPQDHPNMQGVVWFSRVFYAQGFEDAAVQVGLRCYLRCEAGFDYVLHRHAHGWVVDTVERPELRDWTCNLWNQPTSPAVAGLVLEDSTSGPPKMGDLFVRETGCYLFLPPNGRFEVHVPSAGAYHLKVNYWATVELAERSYVVTLGRDGTTSPAVLQVKTAPCEPKDSATVRLQGVVRSQAIGPLEGVNVFIHGTACRTWTDSLGQWTIFGVPRAKLRVSIFTGGYYSRVVAVSPDSVSQRIDVVLIPCAPEAPQPRWRPPTATCDLPPD